MLKSENIRIRTIEKNDFELFYKWMTNQEHRGNFEDAELTYKETINEFFETLIKDKNRIFTIIEDSNFNPIGIISCREIGRDCSTMEVGMLIAESSYRGKGIGKESLKMIIDYLFNTKPVMRIQFTTRVDNISMRKIGESTGFLLEGILRKYKFSQGDYRNYNMMSILREEWASK